jgi:RNA recognition motif-containing protein
VRKYSKSRSRSRERGRKLKPWQNNNDSIDREDIKKRQLFIGNFPYRITWQQLKDVFKEYGEVQRVSIPEDKMVNFHV